MADPGSVHLGPGKGLVTNYGEKGDGGLQNGRGRGHVNFYPYEKRRGERKHFCHAEGNGRFSKIVHIFPN